MRAFKDIRFRILVQPITIIKKRANALFEFGASNGKPFSLYPIKLSNAARNCLRVSDQISQVVSNFIRVCFSSRGFATLSKVRTKIGTDGRCQKQ
jgi:hypothetical protein